MPGNDVVFVGTWTFTANPSFNVIYTVSGDAPTTFAPALNTLGGAYQVGATVNIAADLTTTATTGPGGQLGTWTFDGWDRIAPFTMPSEDVTITGTWTFVPAGSFIVEYAVAGDAPATFAPALNTLGGAYQVGATVNIAEALTTTETTHPDGRIGTWTFDGWDRSASFTMPGENVTITGTWTFEAGYFQIIYAFDTAVALPASAPAVPDNRTKAAGTAGLSPTALVMPTLLEVYSAGLTVTGTNATGQTGTWTFGGWQTDCVDAVPFTMPYGNVYFTGPWAFTAQPVEGDYALTAIKEASMPHGSHVVVGDTITYTITVQNVGDIASGAVTIVDTIPLGMTLVPGSYVATTNNGMVAQHIAPSVSGQTLTWAIPAIAVGEVVTVSFDVTVDPLPQGVYHRTFANTAVVNGDSSNTVTVYTDGLVKNPDRTVVRIGETIDWTLRGFHNPTGQAVDSFTIMDMPGVGLNFQRGVLPAFAGGAGITYEIRYTVQGSHQVHTLATGVDAGAPFTFTLPQPGNLYYTSIEFYFGTVPAGFGLGSEIVLTFVVGSGAPNNTLVNHFWISYNHIERPGSSPDRPVVLPPDVPGTPGTPAPDVPGAPAPGTPIAPPGPGAPQLPWPVGPGSQAPGAGDSATDDVLYVTYDLVAVNPMPISPLHHAYMIGFQEDGTVRPQANMTRAEAVTIFFRLMDDSHRATVWSQENSFNDVNEGQWFNNAVSTMANAGIITGHGGYFRPNDPITRAEFAVFAARFMGYDASTVSGNRFTDVAGHWAESEINVANELGWVTGFHDGTFRPNQHITRAEVAALTNRVLRRLPETVDDLLPDMIVWPDNMNQSAWYFLYIQEATNSNYFEMKDDGVHKTWTGLFAPRNWRALERPYATPWSR
jgi:uncharacterized repeat protein (TIGR01451 family)